MSKRSPKEMADDAITRARRQHGGHLVEAGLRAEGLAKSLKETASVVLLQGGKTTKAQRADWIARSEALTAELRALNGGSE